MAWPPSRFWLRFCGTAARHVATTRGTRLACQRVPQRTGRLRRDELVHADAAIPQTDVVAGVDAPGVEVVKAGPLEQTELPDGLVHVAGVEHPDVGELVEV